MYISNILEDHIGCVGLVDQMQQDAPLKAVNSARISYNKTKSDFDEADRSLAGFLWDNQHTSPFRHSYFTFHWTAPLFVFRQAFKYQVGSTWREYEVDGQTVNVDIFDMMFDTDKGCSWNEISGRYVKWGFDFYVPMRMRGNPPHGNKQHSEDLGDDFNHKACRKVMKTQVEESVGTYNELLSRGVAKEIARMALPQNLYSEAYWTVSLQGVLHFLQQRLAPHAQWEIRKYAEAIQQLLQPTLDQLGIEINPI